MTASDLSLIQKLGQLPAHRLAQVEDFVDFLRAREQALQQAGPQSGPQSGQQTPADGGAAPGTTATGAASAPATAQPTLFEQAGALLPTAGAAALGSVAGVAGLLALGSLWDSVTEGDDDLF
jgi:hypothetical protein